MADRAAGLNASTTGPWVVLEVTDVGVTGGETTGVEVTSVLVDGTVGTLLLVGVETADEVVSTGFSSVMVTIGGNEERVISTEESVELGVDCSLETPEAGLEASLVGADVGETLVGADVGAALVGEDEG
ncbi:hypothetical protein GGI06_003952 [Coemansia sp. S85]|nr:hypothetical protein GGI06_003952 [Coemansia sp. S85]